MRETKKKGTVRDVRCERKRKRNGREEKLGKLEKRGVGREVRGEG